MIYRYTSIKFILKKGVTVKLKYFTIYYVFFSIVSSERVPDQLSLIQSEQLYGKEEVDWRPLVSELFVARRLQQLELKLDSTAEADIEIFGKALTTTIQDQFSLVKDGIRSLLHTDYDERSGRKNRLGLYAFTMNDGRLTCAPSATIIKILLNCTPRAQRELKAKDQCPYTFAQLANDKTLPGQEYLASILLWHALTENALRILTNGSMISRHSLDQTDLQQADKLFPHEKAKRLQVQEVPLSVTSVATVLSKMNSTPASPEKKSTEGKEENRFACSGILPGIECYLSGAENFYSLTGQRPRILESVRTDTQRVPVDGVESSSCSSRNGGKSDDDDAVNGLEGLEM